MATIETLLLWTVLCATTPDTVLLQFSSDNCGPCKAMQPVVQQLTAEGLAIKRIDIDRDPAMAQRFHITGVPTFVVISGGKEVARHRGAANAETLRELLGLPQVPRAEAPLAMPARKSNTSLATSTVKHPPQVRNTQMRTPVVAVKDPVTLAQQATVRLKIEDPKGISYGTGTIVDTQQNEALVLTCGHIFRASKGTGKISIDLYGAGGKEPVEGTLIAHDLERDVALVSMHPGMPVTAVQIAPAGYELKVAQQVFSVGCDKGKMPSVQDAQITSLNRFQRPSHICVSSEPADGRSGGGLFSLSDGYLIGVCNAAIPTDHQGLFAGLGAVHWQLDEIGHSQIYARGTEHLPEESPLDNEQEPAPRGNNVAPGLLAAEEPKAMVPYETAIAPIEPEAIDESQPVTPAAHDVAIADLEDTEVICVVRSRKNPSAQSKVFVVENVTPDLLAQLSSVGRPAPTERVAVTPKAREQNRDDRNLPPVRMADKQRSNGVILRGQSSH